MLTVTAMLNNARPACVLKSFTKTRKALETNTGCHITTSFGIGLGNKTNCSAPFNHKGWLRCFNTLEVKTETHPFSLRSASPDTSSLVTIFLLNSVSANIRVPAVLHAGAMTSSVTARGFESRLMRSGSTCFAETTKQNHHSYIYNSSTYKPNI